MEQQELDVILDKEGSELKQWKVHAVNISLIALALVVNMLRGSPKVPSIIGIPKCGDLDWAILLAFIFVALVTTQSNVERARRTQQLKKKYERGIVPGTIEYSGKPLK